jgi:hypothetical protein
MLTLWLAEQDSFRAEKAAGRPRLGPEAEERLALTDERQKIWGEDTDHYRLFEAMMALAERAVRRLAELDDGHRSPAELLQDLCSESALEEGLLREHFGDLYDELFGDDDGS